MPHGERLACLQNLLENLPESSPSWDLSSTRYSFSKYRHPILVASTCTIFRCQHFSGSLLVLVVVTQTYHHCQLLAIRIYSASVNSMADERTASNFTWFNSSLRNQQKVETLTWMIQIRQWVLHVVRIFVRTQGTP